MYQRNVMTRITAALADTPVVFINGPRQTGKTTLVQQIASQHADSTYVTFDDAGTLAAAAHDPAGFIRHSAGMVIIDEVQKVPTLFPALKLAVDRDRRPGRFLLTGSANVLTLPRLSESLAGRMEIIALWPLSQGELAGVRDHFIERVFRPSTLRMGRIAAAPPGHTARIARGGFPEAVARVDERRRHEWFGAYLTTVLQRDVRDLAHIIGLTDMPRLLTLLAGRAGNLLNIADVSRSLGIPHSTLKRYLTLLEATFLIRVVPPWHANISKRLVKTPKVYLCDTGLMAYLHGSTAATLAAATPGKGALYENFVLAELLKQMTWCGTAAALWHFRTAAGREVDCVLEARDGRLVGIEVKASATVGAADFAGLRELATLAKKRFVAGVILYAGDMLVPFGEQCWAVPLQVLWAVG